MFKPVRVVATIIFLASIGLVFVAAFVIRQDVSASLPLDLFKLSTLNAVPALASSSA
jgi:hypothetical protein